MFSISLLPFPAVTEFVWTVVKSDEDTANYGTDL
jgi:hypothetical protein